MRATDDTRAERAQALTDRLEAEVTSATPDWSNVRRDALRLERVAAAALREASHARP